ncbi:DUF4158 domain-containing protein [Amycolatopsis sp. NPDC059090]|uniref:DUF4158 domain-containing protein n=1 Tax=Amycolatopsis sp. NPDC059090 TaxID=3346723 RepID=UPI003672A2D3
MPRVSEQDELIEHWTRLGDEVALVEGKRGRNALAFGLLVRFYARRGRFPHGRLELPDQVVEFVAKQVRVSAVELSSYGWTGRTHERHRAEIRGFFGFVECSVADQSDATDWLVAEVTEVERRPEQVRAELLGWLRGRRLEPPTAGRIDRIVRSALDRGEAQLMELVAALLTEDVRARLNELVFAVPDERAEPAEREDSARDVLVWVKSDPGRLSLNTMLDEIAKLETIRAIGLPGELLVWVASKIVTGWRARAAVQSPSHFRGFASTTWWVLLSALLVEREREITDTLVE